MTRTHLTDDDLDRLLAARDPVEREALSHASVAPAVSELHDALLGEAQLAERLGGAGRVLRPAWRPRRARRRLALSGALVGALAAGILATGALVPSGGHVGTGVAPASAAVVLDNAARAALRQAALYPTARQYEFLATREGYTTSAGEVDVSEHMHGRHQIVSGSGRTLWSAWIHGSQISEEWYRADGSGRRRVVDTGRGFLTPRDAAVARAHGETLAQLMPNQSMDARFPAGSLGFGPVTPAASRRIPPSC